MEKAPRRCKWRARRIAWCRKLKKFCNAPREYETCPYYEPVHRNITFPVETKGSPSNLKLKQPVKLICTRCGWEKIVTDPLEAMSITESSYRAAREKRELTCPKCGYPIIAEPCILYPRGWEVLGRLIESNTWSLGVYGTPQTTEVERESQTLELKYQHGSQLRQLITEAHTQNREVGVMLCRNPAGNIHLSRQCWGRRETVTVTDCHDGLSPLGSFHVHLGGTGVFSVPDLELAIRKEQLSCLGYIKEGVPMLKCIMPKKYYELPPETKAEIKRSLNQARTDIERATQLFRQSPTNPEARILSQRAQTALSSIERILGATEVALATY